MNYTIHRMLDKVGQVYQKKIVEKEEDELSATSCNSMHNGRRGQQRKNGELHLRFWFLDLNITDLFMAFRTNLSSYFRFIGYSRRRDKKRREVVLSWFYAKHTSACARRLSSYFLIVLDALSRSILKGQLYLVFVTHADRLRVSLFSLSIWSIRFQS